MYKKIVSMFLALSLVLGMTSAVFATENTPATKGTITVKNAAENTALNLYKIVTYKANSTGFEGVSSPEMSDGYISVFVDVINGTDNSGYNKPEKEGANLVKHGTIATTASTRDILAYITENLKTDNSTFAKDLARALEAYVKGKSVDASYTSAVDGLYNNGVITFENIDMGYYLILDETVSAENVHYDPVVMLLPAEDVTITLKSSHYTELEKTVNDNDESVSAELGETVNFEINAAIPNYGDAVSWYYTITDTMTNGLSYLEDTATIKIGDAEAIPLVWDTTTDSTDGNAKVRTITFTNADALAYGTKIYISYDAKVVGGYDNTNTVEDNTEGGSTTVTVYTYGVNINKVDETGEPLQGVEFGIYAGEESVENPTLLYFFYNETDNRYELSAADVQGATQVLTTNNAGKIVVYGLEAGDYVLRETKALDGYNPIADELFELGEDVEDTRLVDGFITFDITNIFGIILPGTGGIGTAAFKATGSAMMLCAAAFMFFRKRRFAA